MKETKQQKQERRYEELRTIYSQKPILSIARQKKIAQPKKITPVVQLHYGRAVVIQLATSIFIATLLIATQFILGRII